MVPYQVGEGVVLLPLQYTEQQSYLPHLPQLAEVLHPVQHEYLPHCPQVSIAVMGRRICEGAAKHRPRLVWPQIY